MLIGLSKKLLKDVQVIPATAHYRQAVEKTYGHRLDVCNKHTEVAEIEAAIGQGQIEELIRMAKDEERLIPKMAGARKTARAGHPTMTDGPLASPAPCPASTDAERGRAGKYQFFAHAKNVCGPAEWKPWDVPDDYKISVTEYADNLPKPKK